MKFTLEDVERDNVDIKKKKKKKKQQPKYTHLPEDDIPYSRSDFSRFVDSTYEEDYTD